MLTLHPLPVNIVREKTAKFLAGLVSDSHVYVCSLDLFSPIITPFWHQIIWCIGNEIKRTHLCIFPCNSAVLLQPGCKYKFKLKYKFNYKYMYKWYWRTLLCIFHANLQFGIQIDNSWTDLFAFLLCDVLSSLPKISQTIQLVLHQNCLKNVFFCKNCKSFCPQEILTSPLFIATKYSVYL